jgi:hypothetical protein
MSEKLNCWEFMNCGRGPADNDHKSPGLCLVSSEISASGLNGGMNGGRLCWVINEAYCASKAASKCFQCEFRYKVMAEEGFFNSCKAAGEYLINLRIDKSKTGCQDYPFLKA